MESKALKGSYDIIIIGSGAGGGTLAHALATSGVRVLLLERGGYLPREKANWDANAVFVDNRYTADEEWYDKNGDPFQPGTHYYVGGNTKMYGAALLRLRRQDFGQIQHYGGISPAWPIRYEELQPYYLAAERLYEVHGNRGEDPTEPPEKEPYFYPAVSHDPYIDEIYEGTRKLGLKSFHLPLAIRLNEKNRENSPCIRCSTCDGYPCLADAKSDAHVTCVRPALKTGNLTLLCNAYVRRLNTDSTGSKVTEVEVDYEGKEMRLSAPLIVVSCGAVNSSALLLRSKSAQHPEGLANSSGVVGRNYVCHQNTVICAVSEKINTSIFSKTIGINDFYFSAPNSSMPLGHIQLLGKVDKAMLRSDAPRFVPGVALEYVAEHSVGWWITSEDLPDPNNRVTVDEKGKIHLSYTPNNVKAHELLLEKLKEVLNAIGPHTHIFPASIYLSKRIPIGGVAHQAGTIRFGKDPTTSALDTTCKAHDLDNLYVVDSSFFPSIGAVNPSLTIIANALRVADILKQKYFSKSALKSPR